jgi:hypothetical protein
MRLSPTLRLVLSAGVLAALPALAAPTNEAPAKPENTAPLGTSLPVPSGNRSTDTRTIDILVEMQQPSAGIQFNERAPRSSSPESRQRAATPPAGAVPPPLPQGMDAPPTSPAGLFGMDATPAVQSRNSSVMEPASPRAASPAPSPGRPSSDVPPELKRWLSWPRDFMEYVRENRFFVAGTAAALLLLAWTGSVMFSRRRG